MVRQILLLVVAGALLGLTGGCDDDSSSPTGFRHSAEEDFSQEFAVTTQLKFELEGINGNVTIAGVADTDSVSVSGTRRVDSDSEADAEQRLEDLKVEMISDEDMIFVQTVQPKDTEGRDYTVDYDVTLPADLPRKVLTINGDLLSTSATSDVTLQVVNGSLTARGVEANATLILVNGNIVAEVSIPAEGSATLWNTNGNVDLEIPSDTSAQVFATLANGVISTSGLTFSLLSQTPRTLDGRLGAGDGTIEVRTTNGNIAIRGR